MSFAGRQQATQVTSPVGQMFDELYASTERYWWDKEDPYNTSADAYPYSLITQMMLRRLPSRAPAGARALDLGAGEGADAIRLALLGYKVTAVEISEEGCRKILRFATGAGAEVEAVHGDVSAYEPGGPFDVVVCNGVLHYVEDKLPVIERMQAATAPGGLNVISVWSTYSPVPEPHMVVPVFCDDEDGTITKSYSGWDTELLYFERGKPETSHSTAEPHVHSHIKLIARKAR